MEILWIQIIKNCSERTSSTIIVSHIYISCPIVHFIETSVILQHSLKHPHSSFRAHSNLRVSPHSLSVLLRHLVASYSSLPSHLVHFLASLIRSCFLQSVPQCLQSFLTFFSKNFLITQSLPFFHILIRFWIAWDFLPITWTLLSNQSFLSNENVSNFWRSSANCNFATLVQMWIFYMATVRRQDSSDGKLSWKILSFCYTLATDTSMISQCQCSAHAKASY